MLGWTVLAVTTLLVTLVVGILTHELLHAIALRSAGVDCSLRFLPDTEAETGLEALATGAWASVGIDAVPRTCTTWRLRVAALAPLAMLVPVGCYAVFLGQGHLVGSQIETLAIIAWMGCALPSPADFAIVWHPGDVRTLTEDTPATGPGTVGGNRRGRTR